MKRVFCIFLIFLSAFLSGCAQNPNVNISSKTATKETVQQEPQTTPFQGSIIKGQREGQGKYTWPNGDIYTGEWKEDKINGFGILKYKNGDEYSGTFISNLKDGQGTFKWKNGDIYVGEWKNDQITGQGTYSFINGDKYIGQWSNNKMNGNGQYVLKNGQSQTGKWSGNVYQN